jgi:Putative Ig domain
MAASTRLMTFVAFLLLAVAPSLSMAAFTYTYTGDDYSGGTNGVFLTAPASPPRVSGSFTVSNLLLPNSTLNVSNLVSYSFNNGLETIDQDNGVIYVFRVSTDAQGLISQTEIQVQKWDSIAAVGSYLDDIEIINLPNRINRTYYDAKCTQLQSNACSGLEFVTTGPSTSSYADWTSGTWQSPLQAIAGQNPLYVSSSTTLNVRGGNGSSGAVTYQLVSGPCTLVGNLLTGTGTGDCIVTVTQAADGSHPQETSAPTTINVIQAPPLVVTAEENPIQISGSTTLTTSGGNGSTGTVTYQLISGPCTLSENVITGTGLGDCVAKATQAADSFHPQMTSAPATITVSLTPQSSLYVAANPSSIGPGQTTHLNTSGGSGTGVVSYQLINGPCTLNGSVLSGTSVGTCMVTATKAGDSSYAPITTPPLAVAVSLTPQIWSTPPSNLSQPAYDFDPEGTQLTLSGDGTRAAAVWWFYDGTNAKVQFSSAIINGNTADWIASVDISPPGLEAGYPQIALSADGSKAIAIWQLYDGSNSVIQSAVASITGNQAIWSIPETLTASGLDSESPQVALSPDGTKSIAIWQMYDGTHSVVQSSTATISGVTATWSSAVNLSTQATDSWNPQVLLAEDGSLSTAIWVHSDGGNTIIQSSSSTLSGNTATWGGIVNLSQSDSDAEQPSFSLSGNGTKALAIWRQSVGRNQVIRSSSAMIAGSTANWSSAVDVTPASSSANQGQVALSKDGEQGIAIWVSSLGGYDLIESATANLSESPMNWSPVSSLSANGSDARSPQIKISHEGTRATAVWWEENNETLTVHSTSATFNDSVISWSGVAGISETDKFSVYPKLALSGDGTRATAIWSVFSPINYSFYTQSSSATILYPALSPSSQSITGSIGVAIPPTTPFNAQGLYGTISYTISPALPTGLTLNSATGVISGISYSSVSPTAYIVTGIGSMGGTASAEVTLEIPEGPPIVTNLVATPAPGPSIILTFNIGTASISTVARSTAVVVYTGTCISSDGGVTATGTGLGSPISVPGVTSGKIYSCVVTGSDGSGSSTSAPSNAVVPIPAPPPNSIPTLSSSAKGLSILFLLIIGLWSHRRLMT